MKKIPGGLAVNTFLRKYWQKKPLLIRQAFPDFKGLLSPRQLISLAGTEDVQARLITQRKKQWQLRHGPFPKTEFDKLGKNKWTVLVQEVNHLLPQAAKLLQHFSFIPHARLDDLMVSYATQGGGVGPHFDSYDVFLLQGRGRRRWQISAQQDHTLVEHAPLKILRNFQAEQEWVLAPGDMLYLPPHYAHNGIAEDDCMTYSIGFRAPAYQELAEQFLVYMQDRLCLEGMYADPHLNLQAHPSEISADMLRQMQQIIQKIKWDERDIADFVGCYLSEPKPHIFFEAPAKPLSQARFKQRLKTGGIMLMPQSQILCHGNTVFINGTAHPTDQATYRLLRTLANTRRLDATPALSLAALELLYQCYLDGYIVPVDKPGA